MQFALMTEPHLGLSYDTLRDLAGFAEDSGLAAFARSDHYAVSGMPDLPASDAFATLGGLARDTRRVELVVLVSPITFRHPAVLAKMAATLDEMTGGRFVLGVGTGWMEVEHRRFGLPFPDLATRFGLLEEALAYLHHAFGRRPGPYAGSHYSLEESPVYPTGSGVRLIVGGSGERRTPRLAGAWADEYNMTLRQPADLAPRIARVREAAAAAGRDPAAVRISVMTQAITGETAADYARNLARVVAADPWQVQRGDLEAHFRQRGFPLGTGPEVRERIAELAALGVNRLYLQHFGPYDRDFLAETFAVLRDGLG